VYELAQGKLKAIEADIEALKRTKRYLQKVLANWEERTQRAGPGQPSHLLYSLNEAVENASLTERQFRRKQMMKVPITILLFGALQLTAQDMQSCPMHKEHMKAVSQHQVDVEKHGDQAMGFPHDKPLIISACTPTVGRSK